jgi:hypothetical protein
MQLKPAIHWMLLSVLLVKLSEEPALSTFSLSINMILYDFFSVFPFSILSFFFQNIFILKFKIFLMGCLVQSLLPQEEAVIFVVSTTGQGDTPDAMKVAFF